MYTKYNLSTIFDLSSKKNAKYSSSRYLKHSTIPASFLCLLAKSKSMGSTGLQEALCFNRIRFFNGYLRAEKDPTKMLTTNTCHQNQEWKKEKTSTRRLSIYKYVLSNTQFDILKLVAKRKKSQSMTGWLRFQANHGCETGDLVQGIYIIYKSI